MADARPPVLEVRDLSIALPKGSDRPHAVEQVAAAVRAGQRID